MWVASPEAYEIRVRALSAENVGETVSLGISYRPSWLGDDETSMLLINGLTGNLKMGRQHACRDDCDPTSRSTSNSKLMSYETAIISYCFLLSGGSGFYRLRQV